jgi:antitoxin component HigA of HigAB toxin-antitoxin module
MSTENITALELAIEQFPFIYEIRTPEEHEKALILMDQLTDYYDVNVAIIDILWPTIERYEESAPELTKFNDELAKLDRGGRD